MDFEIYYCLNCGRQFSYGLAKHLHFKCNHCQKRLHKVIFAEHTFSDDRRNYSVDDEGMHHYESRLAAAPGRDEES